ncbi:MAG: squalene/phytoene synthase family protein [Chthoniobacterales bacterium]|nr:squalene/phytoene synthase family protein [Chthoniobacterales bacterium]
MIALAPAESAKRSHLAFALLWLPVERRRDAMIFFRFCRAVDDIADEAGRNEEERRHLLQEWLAAVESHRLPAELETVVQIHAIERTLLSEIIRGCAMDIRPARFETFADLEKYCWRVACAVGLASVRIFGCKESASTLYAENLGHALQLTNILRDVGEDAAAGRIYLPLADLHRFEVREEDLLQGKSPSGFLPLMRFEAGRARARFHAAVPPAADKQELLAPEIMKAIYFRILSRLEKSQFPVFARRIHIGKTEKLLIALAQTLRLRLS